MLDTTLIKSVYGIEEFVGCNEAALVRLRDTYGTLPQVLEDFFCTAGGTEVLRHCQDTWIFPDYYERYTWMLDEATSGYLVVMNENQGVYQLAIRRDDLSENDPPVYVLDGDTPLGICADTLSEFIMGMLLYQAVLSMEHSPQDFFRYSDADKAVIERSLVRLPYCIRNWFSDTITFFTNADDNLLYLMYDGDDTLGTFGAMSADGYDRLFSVVGKLGESM